MTLYIYTCIIVFQQKIAGFNSYRSKKQCIIIENQLWSIIEHANRHDQCRIMLCNLSFFCEIRNDRKIPNCKVGKMTKLTDENEHELSNW